VRIAVLSVLSMLVAWWLGGPPCTAAQPAPPPAAAPAGTGPHAAGAAIEPRADAGWLLYHEALRAALGGRRARARALVAELRRAHGAHPAAALAARAALAAEAPARPPARPPAERASPGARAELALFQTLHGAVLGGELCVVIQCDSSGALLGLAVVGGAAGAAASLVAAPALTPGQRALVNSGTAWGAYNALLVLLAAEPDDAQAAAALMMAGQIGGLAAGAALSQRPITAGQVALASTGGTWAAGLTGLLIAAAAPDAASAEVSLALLIAADAGLALGAYFARESPTISRAHTLAIDAGGVAGGVAGAGLAAVITGEAGGRGGAAAAALGAALGLGVASYATRRWSDRRDADDRGGAGLALAPAAAGRGAVLGLGGT
jgi:hypothetical protein